MTTDLGTLGEIAERTGGRVIGDAGVRVGRIAAIDDVDATALTFATDERFLRAALDSRAAAILAGEALVDPAATYAKPIVAVASPRLALATLLAVLEKPRPRGPYVDPSAVVDPSATLGRDVYVGPLVAVGAEASIGAETVLAAGVVIGAGARVGAGCMLHPRAYVGERCVLGDRVVLQPQAVVGSDGFGWAFLDGTLQKIPQIGIVELGDDVEIGANTCIDRAQTGVTVDRQRHEDRQPLPDRTQLPHRATYRDRRANGARRHDDDRRLRADRRPERLCADTSRSVRARRSAPVRRCGATSTRARR